MTETPNDQTQSATPPYSAPSAYPTASPAYPTQPAGPTLPTQPSAPAYPTQAPPPAGQPGGYPTAVMPVSAYPATGYPGAPYPAPAPAAPARRTSALTWVFLGLSIVLFLAAVGLGYGYYAAYTEVEDRNSRIGDLQGVVAERDREIEQLKDDLATTEADLTDAQACIDAMEAFVDLPQSASDAEIGRAIDEMFDICGF